MLRKNDLKSTLIRKVVQDMTYFQEFFFSKKAGFFLMNKENNKSHTWNLDANTNSSFCSIQNIFSVLNYFLIDIANFLLFLNN